MTDASDAWAIRERYHAEASFSMRDCLTQGQATPTIYVVKKGDTMSKIANKFDLTVEQLLAANAQIKNPNKISIGDEVTIPLPEAEAESS